MLVAGLGNPGEKYKNTRHNVGFKVADRLKERESFPDFKFNSKFEGLISKRGRHFLLKPQTYMNRSGMAVRTLADYYDIDYENVVIIHDDADFPLGKLKVDKNRSSGGHKGVQSVIDHLSTKKFWRLRMGIRTGDKKAGELALEKFSKKERGLLEKVLERATNKTAQFLEEEPEKETLKIKKD